MFAGIRHFRHHLEGCQFTIWTDHKPLTFALSRLTDSWTAKQQRQLSYVAEFTSKIVHVPGKLNMWPSCSLGPHRQSLLLGQPRQPA